MYEPFACTASVICEVPIHRQYSHTAILKRVAYLLPRSDLGIIPDARSMRLAAGLRGNIRCLRNKKRAGHAGALCVKLDAEVGVHMCRIGAVAGLGREDDAVGECDVANLDGLEERGGGVGVGRHAV